MVDEVIDPADTRIKIIEALELTCNKQEKLPKRSKMVHNTAPT
jgi:acetyl-CoA carboxylase carboxyltransferase component